LIDFGIGLENRPHDFLLPAEALAAAYFSARYPQLGTSPS